MDNFPEVFELIGFFESEPEVTDRDVPWFYNRLTFRTSRGEDRLICEIEPGYGQIDLTWTRANKEIASFALRDLISLSVKSGPGDEYMTASFRHPDLLDFVLYLKPSVRVQWGNQERL